LARPRVRTAHVSKLFCQEKVVTTVSGKPVPEEVAEFFASGQQASARYEIDADGVVCQVQEITTIHCKPDGSRW
jgi:hypothetical protein